VKISGGSLYIKLPLKDSIFMQEEILIPDALLAMVEGLISAGNVEAGPGSLVALEPHVRFRGAMDPLSKSKAIYLALDTRQRGKAKKKASVYSAQP
jgi:hypothetical protein